MSVRQARPTGGAEMSPRCTSRKALAGLVVAGAVALPATAPAGAKGPPGPGGNGTPSICVQGPGARVTTPAGGPGYGVLGGPPAPGQAYDRVACPPPAGDASETRDRRG